MPSKRNGTMICSLNPSDHTPVERSPKPENKTPPNPNAAFSRLSLNVVDTLISHSGGIDILKPKFAKCDTLHTELC